MSFNKLAAQVVDMAGRDHLEGERKNAAFDVHAMTALIYGGKVSICACLEGVLCNDNRILHERGFVHFLGDMQPSSHTLDPPRIVHN